MGLRMSRGWGVQPSPRRSSRGGAAVALVLLSLGSLAALGAAVGLWVQARTSSAIQAGPRAVATVEATRVTSTSSRSGPIYTAHYRVRFVTRAGTPVTTTVVANGKDPCACARTLVAYEVGDPARAELAGIPTHTAGEAVGLTGLAVLLLGVDVLLLVAMRRFRRRLRGAPSAWESTGPTQADGFGAPADGMDGPALAGRPARSRGVLPRRGMLALAGGVSLAIVAGLVAGYLTRSGPSLRLARLVVHDAAAGQGTTDCLALPPSRPDDVPVGAAWANTVITAALGVAIPSSSSGYPHWYPAAGAFDSTLQPTFLALGGGTPPPGQPSSAYGAWTTPQDVAGAREVDVWSLSSPPAAARFADAYLASTCYRFAWGTGLGAQVATPPAPHPGAEECVLTGVERQPADAAAFCVLPVGRYVVRARVDGLRASAPALVAAASGVITRAFDAAGPPAGG